MPFNWILKLNKLENFLSRQRSKDQVIYIDRHSFKVLIERSQKLDAQLEVALEVLDHFIQIRSDDLFKSGAVVALCEQGRSDVGLIGDDATWNADFFF